MDGFARVNAGVTSPAEFFSEENVARIFVAAGGVQMSGSAADGLGGGAGGGVVAAPARAGHRSPQG